MIEASAFIYQRAPFPSAHAATIAETGTGLVAAWFGGAHEGACDVAIWSARKEGHSWSEPVRLATGSDPDGRPLPCWNPVLFRHRTGQLDLFYKVGPRPRAWWGRKLTSKDDGLSWQDRGRLPVGTEGPAKNKPLELEDGTIVSGASSESWGWRCQIERSTDGGESWSKPVLLNRSWRLPAPFMGIFKANQPTLIDHGGGRIQALCRTKHRRLTECRSRDGGRSWTRMRMTGLANPNSAIDAHKLTDGRIMLVHNPTTDARTPLVVSLSLDGVRFETALVLEDDAFEYSYPSMIQAKNGRVEIVYTWRRTHIRHITLNPDDMP